MGTVSTSEMRRDCGQGGYVERGCGGQRHVAESLGQHKTDSTVVNTNSRLLYENYCVVITDTRIRKDCIEGCGAAEYIRTGIERLKWNEDTLNK